MCNFTVLLTIKSTTPTEETQAIRFSRSHKNTPRAHFRRMHMCFVNAAMRMRNIKTDREIRSELPN